MVWMGASRIACLGGGGDDQLFIFPGFVYILHFYRHLWKKTNKDNSEHPDACGQIANKVDLQLVLFSI